MASPAPAAPLTVLVGSYSPLLREALAALLRASPGFVVIVSPHDPSGAGHLASHPSVVLWEVSGSSDPQSAVHELRTACPPPTPILLLGPPVDGAALAGILRAGAAGYAALDSTPAELVALLRQAARGEIAVSPQLAASLFAQLAAADQRPADFEALSLTDRELEVLRLVASGATNKQMAQKLYLSVRTVEGHLARLYARLGVTTRTEAALVAIRSGWVKP